MSLYRLQIQDKISRLNRDYHFQSAKIIINRVPYFINSWCHFQQMIDSLTTAMRVSAETHQLDISIHLCIDDHSCNRLHWIPKDMEDLFDLITDQYPCSYEVHGQKVRFFYEPKSEEMLRKL